MLWEIWPVHQLHENRNHSKDYSKKKKEKSKERHEEIPEISVREVVRRDKQRVAEKEFNEESDEENRITETFWTEDEIGPFMEPVHPMHTNEEIRTCGILKHLWWWIFR